MKFKDTSQLIILSKLNDRGFMGILCADPVGMVTARGW